MTDLQALRSEFRTLMVLTGLVAGMNNHGYPTLPLSQSNDDPLDSSTSTESNIALNAAARVLVRNTEIIAVAGRNPTLSLGDEKPPWYTSFTAIPNPDFEDPYFKRDTSVPDDHCVLVESGQSHWKHVSKDGWHCLTLK